MSKETIVDRELVNVPVDHIHETESETEQGELDAEAIANAEMLAEMEREFASLSAAPESKRSRVKVYAAIVEPEFKFAAITIRNAWKDRTSTFRVDNTSALARHLATKYNHEWNAATRDAIAAALHAEFRASGVETATSPVNATNGQIVVKCVNVNVKTANGREKLPIIYLTRA